MIQLGEQTVGAYMTPGAVAVDGTSRLTDAIRVLDENGLAAVPVLGYRDKVTGILATSDLLNVFRECQSDLNALSAVNAHTHDFLVNLLMDAGDQRCVRDVMTSPVVAMNVGTSLVQAAKILYDRWFHHLPVVDDLGTPVGILACSDLVRAVAGQGRAG